VHLEQLPAGRDLAQVLLDLLEVVVAQRRSAAAA
jgi:hypothetical protein